MSYRKERMTKAQRDMLSAEADAYLHDHVRFLLKHRMDQDTFGGDESTHEQWVGFAVESVTNKVLRAHTLKKAAEGVETRHGQHQRHAKLRHGRRLDWQDGGTTEWFVLDSGPNYLQYLLDQALNEWPEDAPFGYDRNAEDRRAWVEREIAQQVEREYGVYPEEVRIDASYSPTGHWFANLHFRQAGRRLLVTWDWRQDV